MKFLLEVGHQLDLNVNWDGGGVDNVTYQVSAGSEEVISVTSAGIVEGLMAGVGVVEFVNSNVVVGSAIFEVLTAAEMISRQALRDGDSTLIVQAQEVVPVPAGPVLMHPTTFTGPSVTDPVSGRQIYQNGGYAVSAYGVAYYGIWSPAFGAESALPVWDGLSQTNTSIDTGTPTQWMTWITIPSAKRIAKIEIDIAQATITGTAWRLEALLDTDASIGALGGNGGSWITVVPDTGFTQTSGTVSLTIPHTPSSDVAYKKFKIWFYTHYPVNGVNSRIDVSAIRLYEPV